MKKFLPIILGTDFNSYSVARAIYESFGIKSAVCGAGVLIPFYKSEIAILHTEKGFSSNDEVFVRKLNEVYENNSDIDEFIVFVPTEEYENILLRNYDKLKFDLKIPYPKKELANKLMIKENFYNILEEIGVRYPKSQIVNINNYNDINFDGEIFIKASDYEDFNSYDFEYKKKGYHCKDNNEAIFYLQKIYESGFKGDMVVQNYLYGKDGSEYSLNGYRSTNGKFSMSQARNIFSDKRDMWVGNHIVQCDSDIKEFYDIAKKIITNLGYYGLFNIDFKIDSKDNKIYVLELNIRQGRTFYYSVLSGVNLIEIAIRDLIFNEEMEVYPTKKYNLITQGFNAVKKNMNDDMLIEFNDESRLNNTQNPIIYKKDNSIVRKIKLNNYLDRTDKEIFGK